MREGAIVLLIAATIAGAIAGGLVEYLLGKILPEQPKPKHVIAIIIAILVFALIGENVLSDLFPRPAPPNPIVNGTPTATVMPTLIAPTIMPTPIISTNTAVPPRLESLTAETVLYSGPGTYYVEVTTLSPQEVVRAGIIGIWTEARWYKVSTDRGNGWVSPREVFVTENEALPEIRLESIPIYQSSFDSVGNEWTKDKRDQVPIDGNQFLGQFIDERVEVLLESNSDCREISTPCLVEVSFDLFIIGSWDGEQLTAKCDSKLITGKDRFILAVVDGPELLNETFSNETKETACSAIYLQSYPDGKLNAPQAEAEEDVNLGFLFPRTMADGRLECDTFSAVVYKIRRGFLHDDNILQIAFSGDIKEPNQNFELISTNPVCDNQSGEIVEFNESWGIDDIEVIVLHEVKTVP